MNRIRNYNTNNEMPTRTTRSSNKALRKTRT